MTLLALIIYTRVCIVRPFVCANCVGVYTIERAYARAYIYMHCTCICVSLRLFTRINANAVSNDNRQGRLFASGEEEKYCGGVQPSTFSMILKNSDILQAKNSDTEK